MLLLLSLVTVSGHRDRWKAQQATNQTAVGGDVCPLRVCSAAEDKHNCSMWVRSGEKRPRCGMLPARHRPKQLLVSTYQPGTEPPHECTVCGVSPEVHILSKGRLSSDGGGPVAHPPFPPRTQPTFCAVAGDAAGGEQWPRVSTLKESTLRRDQAIQFLSSTARQCNCQVVGGGEPVTLLGRRVFPVGVSHVRGLCGPRGRRLDVTLQTDKSAGGSNNLVVHGTAAEVGAGAGGAPSTGNGFPVVARFAYQGGGVGSIKYDRAVRCAPAEANGGQRCAALQEACTRMLSDLTTTLELQGVPGWPLLHGLGCCEYRLNATHAAPLVVDARQPLQSSPMWAHYNAPQHHQNHQLKHASSMQPAEEAAASPALSACHDAKPPLSRKQCALRAALLSAELLRGLTEERMLTLQEHIDYRGDIRRRLQEVRGTRVNGPPDGLDQYLAFIEDDRFDLDHGRSQEVPAPGRSLKEKLSPKKPNSPQAVLRGLGTGHGQFAFVPSTGQVAMADTDHFGHVTRTSNLRAPTSYQLKGAAVRADFAACYSNSVLRPLLLLDDKKGEGGVPRPHNLDFVKQLVDEIDARHQLLKADAATLDATERGVVQMSFSCIHAWLRAAAAEMLPAEAMARATPFDRLQGGWGEGV